MAVGAATILGSFAARLGIDTNDYAKGVLQAQAMNSALGQSITNFITNPLLGAVDAFKKVAVGAVDLGKEVLGDAEAVQRLGQQTGATTELLQALAARMEVAGYSSEQGGKALLVLARNMREAMENGGPLKDIFDQLGVSLAPGSSIDSGLAQLLDGLYALPDPAERSALAMKLLGEEAGPRLVNAVGGGSRAINQMVLEGRRLGSVLGDDAVNQLADFNTTLGYTETAIEAVKRNLVARFLTGFIQEFGTGTDEVQGLADMLNTSLGPRMEQIGGHVAKITGNIEQLNAKLEVLVGLLDNTLGRFDRFNDKTGGYLTMSGFGIAERIYREQLRPMLEKIDGDALNFAGSMR